MVTTKEFNDARTDKWKQQFTDDESRIFLIVGMKQNGTYSFVSDETQSKEKIAQKLEEIAKAVRKQI